MQKKPACKRPAASTTDGASAKGQTVEEFMKSIDDGWFLSWGLLAAHVFTAPLILPDCLPDTAVTRALLVFIAYNVLVPPQKCEECGSRAFQPAARSDRDGQRYSWKCEGCAPRHPPLLDHDDVFDGKVRMSSLPLLLFIIVGMSVGDPWRVMIREAGRVLSATVYEDLGRNLRRSIQAAQRTYMLGKGLMKIGSKGCFVGVDETVIGINREKGVNKSAKGIAKKRPKQEPDILA